MVFVNSFPFLPILVTSFSIGTEKVIYFSVFSPKQINYVKVIIIIWSFVKNYGNFCRYTIFKLQVICAAPLYSSR